VGSGWPAPAPWAGIPGPAADRPEIDPIFRCFPARGREEYSPEFFCLNMPAEKTRNAVCPPDLGKVEIRHHHLARRPGVFLFFRPGKQQQPPPAVPGSDRQNPNASSKSIKCLFFPTFFFQLISCSIPFALHHTARFCVPAPFLFSKMGGAEENPPCPPLPPTPGIMNGQKPPRPKNGMKRPVSQGIGLRIAFFGAAPGLCSVLPPPTPPARVADSPCPADIGPGGPFPLRSSKCPPELGSPPPHLVLPFVNREIQQPTPGKSGRSR